ncbi:MAG TPA: hypothetical protein VNF06_00830 [Candidatus Aquilonibacter sp.]|nr:hypothetical protein [Candidatus Aquilonibacter sp.]
MPEALVQTEYPSQLEADRHYLEKSPLFTTKAHMKLLYKEDEPEPIKPVEFGINEIPIGFKNGIFTRENLVTLDLKMNVQSGNAIERKAKSFFIPGIKGTGKTMMAKNIAIGMILKLFMPCLAIDVYDQGELYKSAEPSFEDKKPDGSFEYSEAFRKTIDEELADVGMKRQGLKCFVIAPKFAGEGKRRVDKFYGLGYPQFARMMGPDADASMSILADFLGITGNRANEDILSQVMHDLSIDSWKQFKKAIEKVKDRYRKQDRGKGPTIILNSLDSLIASHAFTDDETEWINLPEIVGTHQMTIFRFKTRKDEDDSYSTQIYQAFIKMAFMETKVELAKWLDKKDPACYIKSDNGVVIFLPEGETLAPRSGKCSIRGMTINIALKDRKALLSSVTDTQSVEKVDLAFVEQSDFVITSVVEAQNKGFLRDRNISDALIEDIFGKLRVGMQTSIKTEQSEFSIISGKGQDMKHEECFGISPVCAWEKQN